MTPKKPVPQRKTDLARRITHAQTELHARSDRWEAMPYGPWLRAMAEQRRVIAALYREASQTVGTDTAEWHAFMDAALMFEMHAGANDNAAAESDRAHLAVVGGEQ